MSWSALPFCHRRSATIACPGDVLYAQKTKKKGMTMKPTPDRRNKRSFAQSMQPNQKLHDNTNPKIALGCSFWGLEKGLDIHPGERNSIGGFRPFQTSNSGLLFSRFFFHTGQVRQLND